MLLAAAAIYVGRLEAAETSNIFSSLPSPSLMVAHGHLVMKLPPLEYAVGVVFGLALALLSVYRLAARGTALSPRPLDAGNAFGRYGAARALALNGFVWVYVLLIVGFAGLLYSGLFHLIRDRFAQTLPGLVRWGPAAPILATFGWTLLSRQFSWFKADSVVEAVVDDVEAQSAKADADHWLSTLAWSKLEAAREVKTTELARLYSVGLLQHALESHCELAIDRGRLASEEVDAVLRELRRVAAGEDDRSRFSNRRLAVQIATRIVPLEALEQTLKNHDRRKAERRVRAVPAPRGKDRRKGQDRRVDGPLLGDVA